MEVFSNQTSHSLCVHKTGRSAIEITDLPDHIGVLEIEDGFNQRDQRVIPQTRLVIVV